MGVKAEVKRICYRHTCKTYRDGGSKLYAIHYELCISCPYAQP